MTTEQRFLQAMAAAVAGKTVDWTDGLSQEEWLALFRLARSHHALPLVYEAVCSSPAADAGSLELLRSIKREVIGTVTAQAVKTHTLLQLYRFLEQRGLRPLVVKGIVCRLRYPMPDHRISADEDLLIPEDRFEDCREALEAFGMVQAGPLDSYEVPFRLPGSPLYIELHRTLFPAESGAYGDLNRFFSRAHDRAVPLQVQGTTLWTMEPGDHLFYLICHAFKHFLHSGFGIRQVCDILRCAQGEGVDFEELYEKCRTIRADRFTAAIFQIGREEFGLELALPKCWMPAELDAAPLLRDLLEAGVYGGSSPTRRHSANMTLHAMTAQKQGTAGSGVLRALFPPARQLRSRYPMLRSRPWLLPVVWVRRILRYRAEAAAADLGPTAAVTVGNRRIALLRYYGILQGKETLP